jgi:hypothetical protein
MIKKAVLLTTLTPFLMVFAPSAFSADGTLYYNNSRFYNSPSAYCSSINKNQSSTYIVHSGVSFVTSTRFNCMGRQYYADNQGEYAGQPVTDSTIVYSTGYVGTCNSHPSCNFDSDFNNAVLTNPDLLPKIDDEQCQSENGGSITLSPSSANYLQTGGSVKTHGGACSISGVGGVTSCFDPGDGVSCSLDIVSESTGEFGTFSSDSSLNGAWGAGDGTFSVVDFSGNDYLTALPGGCSDSSSCVTIGDQSFLVDWDSAPDYFEYVGSDGNTYSKPSSGGGSGGDTGGGDPTDPTNPTDPTDPGGNDGGDSGDDSGGSDGGNDSGDGSGGSSGGGSSGGGSTVPDFEFDESGIIEAIGSAGQSNRNAINALSNDVTSSINNQTNELNNATSAQTDALSGALSNQTDTLSNSLNSQTDTITGALNDQTGTLSGSLDALGTSIVDAINAFGAGSGEGDAEDGDGHGLLAGISRLLNGMVDKLASRFTEEVGDGNDLFNSSGMDQTLDGLAEEQQGYNDEVNTLMDEIGDGSSSSIADQVTSRLPSLPSGSCTPLQFGVMEISCQAFNTIKAWLSWIIYFWTVVSVIDTFFRSGQRTA